MQKAQWCFATGPGGGGRAGGRPGGAARALSAGAAALFSQRRGAKPPSEYPLGEGPVGLVRVFPVD